MGRKALAQIPILIGLLLMAVAIPVATKLVQTNQENRGKATSCYSSGTYICYECCAVASNAGGGMCNCKAIPTPGQPSPTCAPYCRSACTWGCSSMSCTGGTCNPKPTYKDCKVRLCVSNKCNSETKSVLSNQACPSSDCTSDANCTATPTPTSSCTVGSLCKIASQPCCGGLSMTDTSCPNTAKRCTGCIPGGQCKIATQSCCGGVSITDNSCPNTNKRCTGSPSAPTPTSSPSAPTPTSGSGKPNGSTCTFDSHCASGNCVGELGNKKCRAKNDNGSTCTQDSQCASDRCSGGVCAANPTPTVKVCRNDKDYNGDGVVNSLDMIYCSLH